VAATSGAGVDAPRLDLAPSNDLEHDVLQTLTRIPRGQVRTYAWVARQVGRPRAVRAVGNIIARNVVPYVVPCHRVVPSAGGVGNYIFGSEKKRAILEREGVPVQELEALAREHVRYLGSRTTHIFCFPTCKDARRIQEKNRVPFRDADEALESGYRPCRSCQPVVAA
jgi:methylated-DNA-[protein]-cysteine S-methyltransferase